MILYALLFAVAVQAPGTLSDGAVMVTIELSPPRSGELSLVDIGSDECRSVPVTEGKAVVALPQGSRWEIRSGTSAWWLAPELLLVPAGPIVLARRVWDAGTLSGHVRVDARDVPPATIRVSLEPVPAANRPPDLPKNVSVTCPVSAEGSWTCHVPAGSHDLAIRADGFVPVYRWDTDIAAGVRVNAGDIRLRRGSSVSGWVAAEAGRVHLQKARVQLLRLISPSTTGRMQERLNRPVTSASVRADGFFQLTGMPPGTYRLVVEHDDFAPAVLLPLEVYDGAETAVRTRLLLRKPASARLFVEPATHPSGARWRLSVSRNADYGSSVDGPPVFEADADPTGTLIRGLTPGSFQVTISDADGNDLVRRNLDIPSGDVTEIVRMSFVPVEGQVRSHGEPLAAELWFGGERGAVRVRTRSDDTGRFETMLPRDGMWTVEVRAASVGIETAKEVEIRGDPDDPAKVTIELSGSAIRGSVVDENRQPVADAYVSLISETQSLATRTGADGTFAFSSVEKGSAQLAASVRSSDTVRQADPVVVKIAGDGDTAGVELQLLASRRVVGRVVSIRGPVAGASLTIARPGGGAVITTSTDVDGTWSADVPAGDRSAIVTVSPPGHAFRAFEVPLGAAPVVLHVPEAGGTLVVRPREGEPYVIRQDDKVLPFGDLARWAIGHGVRFEAEPDVRRFPHLSAALYVVCTVRSGACKSATLAPGGVVEVDLRK